MLDVIVLGDSCQDIFLGIAEEDAQVYCELNKQHCEIHLNYADKIPVTTKAESVGGNAANAAVSIARLGLQTALYTHVGDDAAGKHILESMTASGVLSDYFVKTKGEATNYNTVLRVLGERTILAFHNDRHYSLPKLLPARWLYLTSMKSGFERVIPAILDYAEQYKVKICYQPGTYQLKQKGHEVEKLLKVTELFIVNREEASRYLGVSEDSKVRDLLYSLHKFGPHQVIITDGKEGSYAYDGKHLSFLPTIPEVKRVESTGAGDGFASATVAALCQGIPLAEAMCWGLIQASSVIQYVGAEAGLLSHDHMQKELLKYRHIVPVAYAG